MIQRIDADAEVAGEAVDRAALKGDDGTDWRSYIGFCGATMPPQRRWHGGCSTLAVRAARSCHKAIIISASP